MLHPPWRFFYGWRDSSLFPFPLFLRSARRHLLLALRRWLAGTCRYGCRVTRYQAAAPGCSVTDHCLPDGMSACCWNQALTAYNRRRYQHTDPDWLTRQPWKHSSANLVYSRFHFVCLYVKWVLAYISKIAMHFHSNSSNISNFYSLEIVDRGSDTQL